MKEFSTQVSEASSFDELVAVAKRRGVAFRKAALIPEALTIMDSLLDLTNQTLAALEDAEQDLGYADRGYEELNDRRISINMAIILFKGKLEKV